MQRGLSAIAEHLVESGMATIHFCCNSFRATFCRHLALLMPLVITNINTEIWFLVFGMQTQSSGEKAVCTFVRTEERSVQIFTALHGMQTRSSDENSLCLSARPSVTRVDCDKTVERFVQIYIPYERSFSLVF